jgi:hypothetical protein
MKLDEEGSLVSPPEVHLAASTSAKQKLGAARKWVHLCFIELKWNDDAIRDPPRYIRRLSVVRVRLEPNLSATEATDGR